MKEKQKFALIGVGGYIAPRHLSSIKETGNELKASFDMNDSVGILDKYFPEASFFTEFERFDRHIYKLFNNGPKEKINYFSICSPNYLHDSHIRFALRSEANVICEKPLVLNPWNIDGIIDLEKQTGCKVNTILQLRLHPAIRKLKDEIKKDFTSKKYEIELTYITSRGNWYLQSWKGDEKKSGGIATNIGIHFFDVLHYLFGKTISSETYLNNDIKAAGFLNLEHANVKWFLSIDKNDLKIGSSAKGIQTFRSMKINEREVEFSTGFEDLHFQSYQQILSGNGFGVEETREAITTVSNIRRQNTIKMQEISDSFFIKKMEE
ncbi:Gfo/Idh/MocA family oxidoreductase [Alphaproteobacteria bacterium]|nr:Gfo/Idh/MocA family oxidoreductase [Alphaproteobacteria bacterium]